MIDFEYYSPTHIYFGRNRYMEVGKIIKSYGYSKILLHYGCSSIKASGLYDKIVSSLKTERISFVELGGVTPNPKISLVRKGVELAKQEKVELILAVGGGSVIDSGKAIACGVYLDDDPWKLNTHEITPQFALPVASILTISAAGSELSNSCVITNEDLKIKSGFNNDLIRPLFTIMDPTLTYTVSPFQTSCGIVDIMMHTLERYLSNVGTNPLQMGFGSAILKSVIKAGTIVLDDPTNYDARSTLMLASSFSHNGLTGIGSKMYFTVHKLEHEISGMFDYVAHGAGLSVLFIAWAKYVYRDFLALFGSLAEDVFGISEEDAEKKAIDGIKRFEEFFKYLNMPTTIEELNIDESALLLMADRITKGDNVKVLGIKDLTKQDIMNIFELAKGGK